MGIYNKKTKKCPLEEDYFATRDRKRKHAANISAYIQWSILLLAIALLFFDWRYAIIAFIWFIINDAMYEKGCKWWMIDEIDTEDPTKGLKIMLKSQTRLIPLLAIGCILVWTNHPFIAIGYGIFAFIYFKIYCDLKLL